MSSSEQDRNSADPIITETITAHEQMVNESIDKSDSEEDLANPVLSEKKQEDDDPKFKSTASELFTMLKQSTLTLMVTTASLFGCEDTTAVAKPDLDNEEEALVNKATNQNTTKCVSILNRTPSIANSRKAISVPQKRTSIDLKLSCVSSEKPRQQRSQSLHIDRFSKTKDIDKGLTKGRIPRSDSTNVILSTQKSRISIRKSSLSVQKKAKSMSQLEEIKEKEKSIDEENRENVISGSNKSFRENHDETDNIEEGESLDEETIAKDDKENKYDNVSVVDDITVKERDELSDQSKKSEVSIKDETEMYDTKDEIEIVRSDDEYEGETNKVTVCDDATTTIDEVNNEKELDDTLINENVRNEDKNDESVIEEPIEEESIKEHKLIRYTPDKESAENVKEIEDEFESKEPFYDSSVINESEATEPLEDETVKEGYENEVTRKEEPTDMKSIEEETDKELSNNDASLKSELVNIEPIDEEPAKDESRNDVSIKEELSNMDLIAQKPEIEEIVKDESVNIVPLDEELGKDESMNDVSIKEEPVNTQSIVEKTKNEEPINDPCVPSLLEERKEVIADDEAVLDNMKEIQGDTYTDDTQTEYMFEKEIKIEKTVEASKFYDILSLNTENEDNRKDKKPETGNVVNDVLIASEINRSYQNEDPDEIVENKTINEQIGDGSKIGGKKEVETKERYTEIADEEKSGIIIRESELKEETIECKSGNEEENEICREDKDCEKNNKTECDDSICIDEKMEKKQVEEIVQDKNLSDDRGLEEECGEVTQAEIVSQSDMARYDSSSEKGEETIYAEVVFEKEKNGDEDVTDNGTTQPSVVTLPKKDDLEMTKCESALNDSVSILDRDHVTETETIGGRSDVSEKGQDPVSQNLHISSDELRDILDFEVDSTDKTYPENTDSSTNAFNESANIIKPVEDKEGTNSGTVTDDHSEANTDKFEGIETSTKSRPQHEFQSEVEGQKISLLEKPKRRQSKVSSSDKRRISSSKSSNSEKLISTENKLSSPTITKKPPILLSRTNKPSSLTSLQSAKKVPLSRKISDMTPERNIKRLSVESIKSKDDILPKCFEESIKNEHIDDVVDDKVSVNEETVMTKEDKQEETKSIPADVELKEKEIIQTDENVQNVIEEDVSKKEVVSNKPRDFKVRANDESKIIDDLKRRLSLKELPVQKDLSVPPSASKLLKRYSSLKEFSLEQRVSTPPVIEETVMETQEDHDKDLMDDDDAKLAVGDQTVLDSIDLKDEKGDKTDETLERNAGKDSSDTKEVNEKEKETEKVKTEDKLNSPMECVELRTLDIESNIEGTKEAITTVTANALSSHESKEDLTEATDQIEDKNEDILNSEINQREILDFEGSAKNATITINTLEPLEETSKEELKETMQPIVKESWTQEAEKKIQKDDETTQDEVKEESNEIILSTRKQSSESEDLKVVLKKKISTTSYKAVPLENYLGLTKPKTPSEVTESRARLDRNKNKNIFVLNPDKNKSKKIDKDSNKSAQSRTLMPIIVSLEKPLKRQASARRKDKLTRLELEEVNDPEKAVNSHKSEIQRIKSNIEEMKIKILRNKKERREFVPYLFNSLQPYGDTNMYEGSRYPSPRSFSGALSRVTAIDLCDPWENHRMDILTLPSIKDSSSFLTNRSDTKSRRKDKENLLSSPTIGDHPARVKSGKSTTRSHRSHSQGNKDRISSRKIEDDYRRTRTELYRMSLDKLNKTSSSSGQANIRSALFAYLQNSPGSKKALYEVIRQNDRVKTAVS